MRPPEPFSWWSGSYERTYLFSASSLWRSLSSTQSSYFWPSGMVAPLRELAGFRVCVNGDTTRKLLVGLCTMEGDLELGGSTQGLLGLAKCLTRKSETRFDLPLYTTGVNPAPHDDVLTRLSVEIGGEQPLYIGRFGSTLRIKVSPSAVEILASNLERLARQASDRPAGPVSAHAHVEYYPGHYFLDERSEPIVIAVL